MLCIPTTKAGKIYDTLILSCLAIRPGRKWQTKRKGAKPVNGDPTHIVRQEHRHRRRTDGLDSGRRRQLRHHPPSHIDIAVRGSVQSSVFCGIPRQSRVQWPFLRILPQQTDMSMASRLTNLSQESRHRCTDQLEYSRCAGRSRTTGQINHPAIYVKHFEPRVDP